MIAVPLNAEKQPVRPNRDVLSEAIRACECYRTKRDFPGDGTYYFIMSVLSAGKWTDYRIGPGHHPEEVIQAAELMAHEAGRYNG